MELVHETAAISTHGGARGDVSGTRLGTRQMLLVRLLKPFFLKRNRRDADRKQQPWCTLSIGRVALFSPSCPDLRK